jgi:ketosteroid isomerase-like protein
MSEADIRLVTEAFAVEIGIEIEMLESFEQEDAIERLSTVVASDAPIVFATPDGGMVGDMAGPFHGVEGLRSGWTEWTAPWESFVFRPTEIIDAPEGRVLLLGDSMGRLAGSGLEVETPVAALYTVRDGLIVRIEHFLDQDQARSAAGL